VKRSVKGSGGRGSGWGRVKIPARSSHMVLVGRSRRLREKSGAGRNRIIRGYQSACAGREGRCRKARRGDIGKNSLEGRKKIALYRQLGRGGAILNKMKDFNEGWTTAGRHQESNGETLLEECKKMGGGNQKERSNPLGRKRLLEKS